ncbi:cysteine proteinase, partial [Trifolium pratense]
MACAYRAAMSSESSSSVDVDDARKQWMSSESSSVDDGDEAHKQWMKKYGIKYANSTEMEKRRKIFKQNLEYIEKMNRINKAAGKTYTLGLNDYSDLTDEEFSATHTGLLIS